MGIRIRPQEIEIPEKDPFKYDLLNRQEPVEVLTHLVSSLEAPYVLAVDAAWGNGKTTFFKMWEQHLKDQCFPVVSFNAWETDFSGHPFIALSSELVRGLREYDDGCQISFQDVESRAERLIDAIIRTGISGIVSVASAVASLETGDPMAGVVTGAAGNVVAAGLEEALKKNGKKVQGLTATYQEATEAVQEFRTTLRETARAVSLARQGRALLIFIDELDRCRPSYAVELLEVAKHFFAVEHIVFVIAIDRSQLVHSIKSLYGSDFDATGYLRRFIDVDFRLPDPDRKAFVNSLLIRTGIDDYLEQKNFESWGTPDDIRKLLLSFFSVPDLSLRRIAQAIHRLGLVFASLGNEQSPSYLPVTVALILRTIDAVLYHRFFRGDASGLEVADKVFNLPGMKNLQQSEEGVLFETMLILAPLDDGIIKLGELEPIKSDLLRRHQDNTSKRPGESVKEHAHKVIDCLDKYKHWKITAHQGLPIGFRQAVQRLELFSTELIDEGSE